MGIIVLYKWYTADFLLSFLSIQSVENGLQLFSSAMMACSSFSRSAFLELGNQSFR